MLGEGDKKALTGGSLREKKKQGIRDGDYRHPVFFNEFTVKGCRVAKGENGVMRVVFLKRE